MYGLPQRRTILTAQYWNPTPDYASPKSGMTLELGTGETVQRNLKIDLLG